jgi:hypothetical protein
MNARARPSVEPIVEAGLEEFAAFLHEHLNRSRTPSVWAADFRRNLRPESPNFGFALRDGTRLVGGIGALYADRPVAGRVERFCNITSWCVLNEYRQHSTRLAMAVLAQGDRTYTDFSPTAVVGSTLRFLKFTELDDRRAVVLNVPGWRPGVRVFTRPEQIRQRLSGEALLAYDDHLCHPWLQHLVVGDDRGWCHVIHRRAQLRNLPAALVLHISDRDVFARSFRRLANHWLGRGLPITLVECRMTHGRPWPSLVQSGFNRKLVRTQSLDPATVDYLYSESVAFDLV